VLKAKDRDEDANTNQTNRGRLFYKAHTEESENNFSVPNLFSRYSYEAQNEFSSYFDP
jgi:hypothetical protein